MKISNLIFIKYDYEIIEITDSSDENPLNWSLMPINEKIIPNEGHFLLRSRQVIEGGERTCWMNISSPEMISDYVFTIDAKNSVLVLNDYYLLADKVIPSRLSNTFTNYEFYYTKERPSIGIEILKREIEVVEQKGFIAEYLGYIYRDEEVYDKAIKWFQKALGYGEPSSEFIYKEIADLYHQTGEDMLAEKYHKMYKQKEAE